MYCPIRILNSENFVVGVADSVQLEPRTRSWNARVSCSQFVFVKVVPANTPRCGVIELTAALTDGDTVALVFFDSDVEFVFGDGTGGTVDKGADEIEAAVNLAAAIEVYALANGRDITITNDAGGFVNMRTQDSWMHVEEVVDDGAVITVTDFVSDVGHYANDVDGMPTNEFEDVVFEVGYGDILSVIGSEPDTTVSVAEIILSS